MTIWTSLVILLVFSLPIVPGIIRTVRTRRFQKRVSVTLKRATVSIKNMQKAFALTASAAKRAENSLNAFSTVIKNKQFEGVTNEYRKTLNKMQ